jgi:hypothetical protein
VRQAQIKYVLERVTNLIPVFSLLARSGRDRRQDNGRVGDQRWPKRRRRARLGL